MDLNFVGGEIVQWTCENIKRIVSAR